MRINDQRKSDMIKCIRGTCTRICLEFQWHFAGGPIVAYRVGTYMYCDIQNHFLPLSSAIRSSNDSVP